jgi:hypothetical protein
MEISPQLIQSVLALTKQDEKKEGLDHQQQLITGIRKRALYPNQGGHMAGKIYIPNSNALTAAADVFAGYKANQAQQGIDAQRTAMGDERSGAREQYLKALIEGLRRKQQVNPQAAMPGAMASMPETEAYPSTPQAGY